MKGFYVLICKHSSISGSTSAIMAVLDIHVKLIDQAWHSSKSIRPQEIFFKTYLKEPWKLNRTILFAAASTSNDDELLADSSDLINNQ